MNKVYITATGQYLPNTPVANDEMELYPGSINNTPSRVKDIFLRKNGIYAATIMDCPEKLTALNNKHPMIPLPMAGAAFRLLLHGFSTEVLHALLVQAKLEQAKEK
ncbi:hypothetical protein SIO70_29570 [Chitinophaga sancti]|uniref:DUF6999 family protein n=1 Tax=Chitinophaga sancti TaxID=1004 RepID=UPI002A7630EB|nr:hypothetical protein [Chitinophaga sancti]WPQ62514.1 hypothetical protein SIO70_29570 [Chitinophaga sancti]